MKTNRIALLLGVLLLLSSAVVLTRLEITTDMGAFLPRGGNVKERLLLEQINRGSSARVLLMAIEGGDEATSSRLSRELAAALRDSRHYQLVHNGEADLLMAAESPWYEYRYLLQESDFSPAGLTHDLQQRLQELRSPLGIFIRQSLAADPTAAYRELIQQWQGGTRPPVRHGVWFSGDGRALLFVQTRAPGYQLDAQQRNLNEIRRLFDGLPGSEQAVLTVTGAPAIAVASRETIRGEAQLASLIATIAVALILLWAYRSPRLWLLSVLPLASGVLVALAVTSLVFGAVHGITIAFGITLLGVAIDYPIHLFSHLAPGESPAKSLQRIWPTLRLGVISTVIGFVSLILGRFEGLQQLGVFAVSGLLTAAVVTRYLLLPLLPANWQGRDFSRPPRATAAPRVRVAGVILVLLTALGYLQLSERPLWEDDLAALSPIPDTVREQDARLRAALPVAELNQLLLLKADNLESLLQAEERLIPTLQRWVDEGLLGGYSLAAQRLPSTASQLARQQRLPGSDELRHNLHLAAAGLPFRVEAFEPFIQAVASSRELAPLTLEQTQHSAQGLSLGDMVMEREGHWWGVVRLAGVESVANLQQHLSEVPLSLQYVNLKTLTESMLNGFRDNALLALTWGALAILLIIALSVRNLERLMRVALPLLAAMTVTVALLHVAGERLTLFHLTALLLVAGIGIDYSLFYSRADNAKEQGRTAHALGVCAISTSTVFAILAYSRLPVLHAIGSTVLTGVIAAYLLARLAAVNVGSDAGNGPEGSVR